MRSKAQNMYHDEHLEPFRHLHATEPSADLVTPSTGGVRLLLYCPQCRFQHIDEGEWETRPHSEHLCLSCGHLWEPFPMPTVGARRNPLSA